MSDRIEIEEGLPEEERSLEENLEHYWEVFKRRWRLGLLAALVTALIMIVPALRSVPIYRAAGTLMIGKENPNVLMLPGMYGGYNSWRNEYLNTQIKILQSRTLARDVVSDLNLIRGQEMAGSAESQSSNAAIYGFLGGLAITPVEDTRLVNVSYVSANPEFAALAVNTLFDNFIRFNLKLKTESTKQASEFLYQSINELKKNLTQKEKELQKYGQQKELFYLSNQDSTVVEKFADINKAYTNAQINRINLEAVFRQLQNKAFDDYGEVRQNTLIQNLKQEYSNLESEYKKKSQIFQDTYPEMRRLKVQMETLQKRINEETGEVGKKALRSAQAEYQSALKKENSLAELLNTQKSEVISTNTDAIYYNSLKIEVNNMRGLLDHLVKKQKESLLTSRLEGLQTSNIKIIDRAEVPMGPISSSRRTAIIKALFVGIFAGVFLIFALDWLDKTLKTPEEAERFLKIPALGMVPELGTEKKNGMYAYSRNKNRRTHMKIEHIELANFKDPESMVAESYRNIRTSIMLSTADGPPRVIAATSSAPREGKTSTVVNLAVSFTKLGKRVLIIDGDLRKPMIHRIFNQKNSSGLSTFLVSQDPGEEIFFKTQVKNLYIIPSGPCPPNPTELLDSARMGALIEKLKKYFDVIFIDAPPLVGIVDPVIIGRHADGMLMVVWWGKSNKKFVARAKAELYKYRVRILGTILNKVNMKKGPGYGQYYAYGTYAYEYSDKDSKKLEKVQSRKKA